MNDDLEAFRLPESVVSDVGDTGRPDAEAIRPGKLKTRRTQRFVKGPIDLPWLKRVAALPGKTPLLIALALHYQSGLSKSKSGLRLTSKLRGEFKIPDRSARLAVKTLETAGLVSVERNPGQCLKVSILDSG